MKREIMGAVGGMLFGAGLAAAGMTDPHRVQAFLDLFGAWDPTLAVVMASAVAVTVIGFRLILRRKTPILDDRFYLPTKKDIDGPLIVGAALFGVGWGLFGYCPGPAIGGLVYGNPETFLFVGALLAGVFLQYFTRRFYPGD